MRISENYVKITGNALGASGMAYKFECHMVNLVPLDTPVITWFPFSQTKSHSKDPNTTGQDTITITEWMAKTKGLL